MKKNLSLTRLFHTPIETPTVRSRRREEADARKLPVYPPPYVGGKECEMSGLMS